MQGVAEPAKRRDKAGASDDEVGGASFGEAGTLVACKSRATTLVHFRVTGSRPPMTAATGGSKCPTGWERGIPGGVRLDPQRRLAREVSDVEVGGVSRDSRCGQLQGPSPESRPGTRAPTPETHQELAMPSALQLSLSPYITLKIPWCFC